MAVEKAGAWVKYDDAMQALSDRQNALDVMTTERNRLLRCVEVGDRMAAFIADYLDIAMKCTVEEAETCAQLWSDTRKLTLGITTLTVGEKP